VQDCFGRRKHEQFDFSTRGFALYLLCVDFSRFGLRDAPQRGTSARLSVFDSRLAA
jgi:hypothetical protein